MKFIPINCSLNFILILLILILGNLFISFGQLEAGYSMYRFNPQVISPAHVGSTARSEITLMNRQQWLGIAGAPKSYVFSGNFKLGSKFGIGLNGMVDQAGPMKISTLSTDLAYHQKIHNEWTISEGFRVGYANLALNFDETNLVHQGDPTFVNRSAMKFNMGWALKIAKGDGFFMSVSKPRLLKYDLGSGFKDAAYIYGMAGTKIKANENITIYPSALFRTAAGVPLSWDANLLINFKKKYDLGLNYRNQDSWGIRAGIQASKSIYLGYVFEMPTAQLSRVSVQSHEIALRVSFNKRVKTETKPVDGPK
jgi:type IX secretion system PorP/SprF family membrane protein